VSISSIFEGCESPTSNLKITVSSKMKNSSATLLITMVKTGLMKTALFSGVSKG
jgi:hypothetical protein